MGLDSADKIPIDQFIVDFYCKELLLAIEVDGSFHFNEGQQEQDTAPQKRLESLGVHVVRFSDLGVKNNLNWVLEQIQKKIQLITAAFNP